MNHALITGASSGLGKELALLLEDNYKITNLSKTKTEFNDIICDLSKELPSLPTDINLLILNAAIMPREKIGEITTINEAFEVNINANIKIVNALLKDLKQRPSDIIIIGSTAAFHATGDNAVYSATKAAFNAFAKSLQKETQDDDIRVMVFHPGAFTSNLRKNNKPSAMNPKDIAEFIVHAINLPRDMQVSQATITRT